MFGKTLTAGINGINTTMIEVEADVSQGNCQKNGIFRRKY